MKALAGISAFPITPTDSTGRVDTPALCRLIDRLVAAKVDSIGLLGSTGTYLYLTREERRRAIEAAVAYTENRVPLVVGIGALRTDETIRLAQDAKVLGAAVGLLSPVSYAPLSENEVFEHFSAVARESQLPICVYDNPGTTHFKFTPALVSRLARVSGIVAIKNPTTNNEETPRHYSEQRAIVPEGFRIGYSGDWCCAEAMILGADAWYSVLGGLLPNPCVRIVRAAQAGDAEEARRINQALQPVWDLFRRYTSLRVMYEMAIQRGVCSVEPPRPILPVCDTAKQDIADVLQGLPKEFLT